MLGKRKTLRIKSAATVKWSTVDLTLQGDGEVVNSSMTGMALLIYKNIDLPIGTMLFVEPRDKITTTLVNRKSRIVWFKKSAEGGIIRYLCGLEFIK
jgi:hypothetical protein